MTPPTPIQQMFPSKHLVIIVYNNSFWGLKKVHFSTTNSSSADPWRLWALCWEPLDKTTKLHHFITSPCSQELFCRMSRFTFDDLSCWLVMEYFFCLFFTFHYSSLWAWREIKLQLCPTKVRNLDKDHKYEKLLNTNHSYKCS